MQFAKFNAYIAPIFFALNFFALSAHAQSAAYVQSEPAGFDLVQQQQPAGGSQTFAFSGGAVGTTFNFTFQAVSATPPIGILGSSLQVQNFSFDPATKTVTVTAVHSGYADPADQAYAGIAALFILWPTGTSGLTTEFTGIHISCNAVSLTPLFTPAHQFFHAFGASIIGEGSMTYNCRGFVPASALVHLSNLYAKTLALTDLRLFIDGVQQDNVFAAAAGGFTFEINLPFPPLPAGISGTSRTVQIDKVGVTPQLTRPTLKIAKKRVVKGKQAALSGEVKGCTTGSTIVITELTKAGFKAVATAAVDPVTCTYGLNLKPKKTAQFRAQNEVGPTLLQKITIIPKQKKSRRA